VLSRGRSAHSLAPTADAWGFGLTLVGVGVEPGLAGLWQCAL